MKNLSDTKRLFRRFARTMLALVMLCALLVPVLAAPAAADHYRKTVPTATPAPEEDYGDYTDDELIELALQAEKTCRNYATVSNTRTALELPYPEEHLDSSLRLEVKFTKNGAIYIMPKPENGHGALDTIKAGTKVTVIAEYKGYYFFVDDDGRMGWNSKDYFTETDGASPARNGRTSVGGTNAAPGDGYGSYTSDELWAVAEEAEKNTRSYSTVSTGKVRLELPYADDRLDVSERMTVAMTKNAALLILPKPATGNGNLGAINAGTAVTVIAECKGYYFFVADDGRMGWTGKDNLTK